MTQGLPEEEGARLILFAPSTIGPSLGLSFPPSLLFLLSSVVVRTKGAIIEETREAGGGGRRQEAGTQTGQEAHSCLLFVSPPFRILNSYCTGPRQASTARFLEHSIPKAAPPFAVHT